MESCEICRTHQEEDIPFLLYADEDWLLRHGNAGIKGYFYLEPRRHVENWSEFSSRELQKIGSLIQKLEAVLKKELPLERLYVVTISEAVRHLHLHLIPRLKHDEIKGLPLIEKATSSSQPLDLTLAQITPLIQKLKENI